MPRARRHPIALIASLVVHGAILGPSVASIQCVPEIELPELDFELTEVELVDPDALQGEEPEAEPQPPPPSPDPPPQPPPPEPQDDASEEQKPEPAPEPPPPEPEKKSFADKSSRAKEPSPPQSTFHMLLVTKKIRRLEFKQQVLDIMAPLPDFEFLIDGGRFDALRDFDHIVIASPDIRNELETFLAVDYNLPLDEMKRAIERAAASQDQVVEWVEDGGPLRTNPRPADPEVEDDDDRWFVFLEGDIAIYVRERFLPNIMAGPQDDERKTAGEFVAKLAKVRRYASRQPRAGMQVVISDLRRRVKRNPLPFQVPDEFEISASAEAEPEVLIRGEFVNVVEAKAFEKWYTETLRAMVDDSFALKLQIGWMLDIFELERDGAKVRLLGTLTTGQAEKVMQLAADLSRKVAKKTPEEVEEMRRRRIEALEARKGGKLPPSALEKPEEPPAPGDGGAVAPAGAPADPSGAAPVDPGPPKAPTAPNSAPEPVPPPPAAPGRPSSAGPTDDSTPSKPTKTPAEGETGATPNR